jgi:arylsulfatase A-like enzyme
MSSKQTAPPTTTTSVLPDEVDLERRDFLRHLKWIALTSGVLAGCGGTDSTPAKPGSPNILAIVIDDLNDWVGFLQSNPQVRPQAVTLPDYLAANGYASALYGKVHHTYDMVQEPYPARIPDRNLVCSGYPTMVTEGLFDWGGMDVDDSQMPDYTYTQQGIDFLAGASTSRPFFLGVGLVRTHVAWYVPQKWLDMFPLDAIQVPVVPADDLDIPPEGRALALAFNYYDCITKQGKWAEAVQAYLASIAFVDAQVGRLLAALDASPHADNTIVVLFSDNGFHLGQKFHWHKEALWEQTTRVPLVIRGRGQAAGATVDAAVSLLDVYPTMMELCKLPGPYALDGSSLAPLMADPMLAWDRPGGEELYVEAADAGEYASVAADPQYADVIASLAAYVPS